MMASDTKHHAGDFESVGPKLQAEKDSILDSISDVEKEQNALIYELNDLNQRIALKEQERKAWDKKLKNNDGLSKYWISVKPTIIG